MHQLISLSGDAPSCDMHRMAPIPRSHEPAFIRCVTQVHIAGLVILAGTFALAPMWFKKRHEYTNFTVRDKALSGNQIMRGPFLNTGSKDAGRDPDWVNGVYVGKARDNFHPTEEQIAHHRQELEKRKAAAASA